MNSIIKISNNSSFVILIFAISELRNIGHSTFVRSKFCPPPFVSIDSQVGTCLRTVHCAGAAAASLFHKLKEKFGKEKKKVFLGQPKSGAQAGEAVVSTWFLYNDLLFLSDHIKARQ